MATGTTHGGKGKRAEAALHVAFELDDLRFLA